MNKNSVMKYLFLQAKVCCDLCIEAEYHAQRCLINSDRSYNPKSVNQIQNCILDSNPDSMKPA